MLRFRGNTHVAATTGERRAAPDWVGKGGRAVKLSGAMVTARPSVISAPSYAAMPRTWLSPGALATSLGDATACEIIEVYAKRWTVEPSFRDTKDIRFGMGLFVLRISRPDRRDRLLLLNAFAVHLLSISATASEELGTDSRLKSNTSKTRTHSLFWQGCMLCELIPIMLVVRLRPLTQRLAEVMQ